MVAPDSVAPVAPGSMPPWPASRKTVWCRSPAVGANEVHAPGLNAAGATAAPPPVLVWPRPAPVAAWPSTRLASDRAAPSQIPAIATTISPTMAVARLRRTAAGRVRCRAGLDSDTAMSFAPLGGRRERDGEEVPGLPGRIQIAVGGALHLAVRGWQGVHPRGSFRPGRPGHLQGEVKEQQNLSPATTGR